MRCMAVTFHTWRTMMANHPVDYKALTANIDTMINLLEYDAMRSSGKMKLNSQHLHSLYYLKDLYAKNNKAPVKKEG